MTPGAEPAMGRRSLLRAAGGVALFGAVSGGASGVAQAKDYRSRREALDGLDSLAAVCRTRLGALKGARREADVIVPRFLDALQKHHSVRESVRRRFSLSPGEDQSPSDGDVDAGLIELRQSLDDLMVAYAETLPVFADSKVVSRLAVDMVEVSRLKTVIDLWATGEGA